MRRLRAERGISATDAAESVGIFPRHWQKLEAGETNVTVGTLARVAKALRVDVRELFA